MALEVTHDHKCSNCDNEPRHDECYCAACREEYANDAYERGKEDGHADGRAEAEAKFKAERNSDKV